MLKMNKKNLGMLTLLMILVVVILISGCARKTEEKPAEKEPTVVSQKEVKGFSGIPIYPGVDYPEKDPNDETKDYSGTTEDGYYFIWYVFNQKLQDEWDNDAESVEKKIVNFYKEELRKRGWEYIGEGVGRHHWTKDEDGIAICIPADYEIEYMRMDSEEAKANTTKLSNEKFIEAFVNCAQEAQKIYEKNGFKTLDDYTNKTMELANKNPEELEKFFDKLRSEVRKITKDTLKPFNISVERFKEQKSENNELIQKYYSENVDEFLRNILGFMAMDEL